jgi:hypothetical protein
LTRLFAGSFFADFSAYGFRLMKSLGAADSMAAMIANAPAPTKASALRRNE